MLKLIPFVDKLNSEQLEISQDFEIAIEQEVDLCIQQIQKLESAIILDENSTDNQDYANRHISSIQQYWQKRLQLLIDFLQTKNHDLSQKVSQRYMSTKR